MTALNTILAIGGIAISLDDTGDMPRLVVSIPNRVTLSNLFVGQCHALAGDHGASIEFQERLA